MLQNTFFRANVYAVDTPNEEYHLVYENSTAGNYETELEWGKYKVVLSGAGGGGGTAAQGVSSSVRSGANGYSGEEKTIYVSVLFNDKVSVSGIIGSGGGYSSAYAVKSANYYPPSATAGVGGAGYENGSNGTQRTIIRGTDYGVASAGGGGGGSSSFVFNNQVTVSAGGNGGGANVKAHGYDTQYSSSGGAGGSGGTTTGTGAAGGAGATRVDGTATSAAGTSGYVRIYKSNILPQG